MSDWISKNTNTKNQVFICPHCSRQVNYIDGNAGKSGKAQCGYIFCPYCAKQIKENDMQSRIKKEDRLIKIMDGHTEEYTDGFYDGVASGHEMCIRATREKVIPTIRIRAIDECIDKIKKYCDSAEYGIDSEAIIKILEEIKEV